MTHIAVLIPGLDRIGGAERQVILLARGLAERGWRVTVVALTGHGGKAAAELTASGVRFISLEMRKGLADPRGWLRFHRRLRLEKPHVVHAHLPHAAWFARWSRLGAPVPVLVDTFHTSATGGIFRRCGYRFSRWLPDRVTCVSHAVADAWLAARTVSPHTLAVLPNGVDVDACQPDAALRATMRRRLGLDEEFLWLAAGRLEAVKDYPTLLRALAALPESARLVIAGAGPAESQLRLLVRELRLESRVSFLGFEPDLYRWMQAADGFVLSSLWEGLPIGLLEAAACALPAVATRVPGTCEVIVDGESGLLAKVRNPSALAAAMTAVMQLSAEDRQAMGSRARARVVERFSLAAVLDQWEALYAELLASNRTPRRWRWSGRPRT